MFLLCDWLIVAVVRWLFTVWIWLRCLIVLLASGFYNLKFVVWMLLLIEDLIGFCLISVCCVCLCFFDYVFLILRCACASLIWNYCFRLDAGLFGRCFWILYLFGLLFLFYCLDRSFKFWILGWSVVWCCAYLVVVWIIGY